ncbi:MAG: hypothetical protein ABIO40_12075 [Devosia sp.]
MRLALLAAAIILASPAFADAVTYRGDLNAIPIVVEFSEPPESAAAGVFGRYFYVTEGIDIPLSTRNVTDGQIELLEESPCDPEECEIDQSGLIVEREPAAIWALTTADDGATLSGTWGPTGSNLLPIHLERTGTRPFVSNDPPSPADLAEFGTYLLGGIDVLTPETSPYDFLKVDVPVTHSDRSRWGNVEFEYVTDSRTLFQYPRVTDLGGADITPVNAILEQRDWAMRLAALNCKAQIFPSMAPGGQVPPDGGTLGGFDEEQIVVDYLSPQLLSFTESGSLFCGNAYPENHAHSFNIDVATGQPVDPSLLVKGFVARDFMSSEIVDLETARQDPASYNWGADEDLAGFILSRASLSTDDGFTEECGYEKLVRNNLAIGFRQPDQIVFRLDGLPHAIQACAEDLLVLPVAELKDHMLPGANRYFPGLLP